MQNERSVVFDAHEVLATLAGKKTQLCRPVDRNDVVWGPSRGMYLGPNESAWWVGRGKYSVSGAQAPPEYLKRGRYGVRGSLLWVRETWAAVSPHADPAPLAECTFEYRADVPLGHLPGDWHHQPDDPDALRWKSATVMPRLASRLTLKVTNVSITRLHTLTLDQARAEGHETSAAFRERWNERSWARASSWDSNPLVWVVGFEPLTQRTIH